MKNLYKIFLLLFAGSAALAMDDKVGDINPASRAPENLNIFKEVDEKEWRAAVVVLPLVISQQGDLDRTVGMPENNTIPFGPTMKGQVDHINSIKRLPPVISQQSHLDKNVNIENQLNLCQAGEEKALADKKLAQKRLIISVLCNGVPAAGLTVFTHYVASKYDISRETFVHGASILAFSTRAVQYARGDTKSSNIYAAWMALNAGLSYFKWTNLSVFGTFLLATKSVNFKDETLGIINSVKNFWKAREDCAAIQEYRQRLA